MQYRDSIADLTLLLFAAAALLAACGPNTPGEPTARPEYVTPAASFHPYSDEQVLGLLQDYPSLGVQYEPDPRDLLERAGIDLTLLEQTGRFVGDCICLTIFDLSPAYEIVVDENACSGYDVYIRKK